MLFLFFCLCCAFTFLITIIMAKLEITGRVHFIGDTITIPSKNDPSKSFNKRELYLDTTPYDRYTGQRSEYESFPKFEYRNSNCAKLDSIKVGDVVKVSFDITGRFYTNRDGQQSHMNSIDAFDVEVVRSEQQPTVQPVQQPQMQQPVQQMAQPMQQPMAQHQYPQAQYPQQPQGKFLF